MNYSIVIGNLFTTYKGDTMCSSLGVYKVVDTVEQVKESVRWLQENKTDLIIVIDLKTGESLSDF